MGRLFKSTMGMIDHGLSGQLLTIPTGITKYDEYVYGTRKKCYYLYGAETGVGKTRFVRDKHIYEVYDYYKKINDPEKFDVRFLDFSLEISAEENLACAISRKLYIEKRIVIPPERLFSWGGKITSETRDLIATYTRYFEEFETKLFVHDEETTPNKFHDILMQYALTMGKFTKVGKYISECEDYVPNNPNLYTIIVIDTVNLADMDSGHETVKSSIDRISRLCVWFRNKCGFTPIIIQQFNAEISSTDRSRYGVSTPLLRDFEDSKRTTKDANVVFGLYDPVRHMKEDQTHFLGYDVVQLKSWIRTLHLLKHRNGQSNKVIPLQYKGAVGMFNQLPDAKDMTPTLYAAYTRY